MSTASTTTKSSPITSSKNIRDYLLNDFIKHSRAYWAKYIAPKLVQSSVLCNIFLCNAIFSLVLYLFLISSVVNDPPSESFISTAHAPISGGMYLVYFIINLLLVFSLGWMTFFAQNLRLKLLSVFMLSVIFSVCSIFILILVSLHVILCNTLITQVNCPTTTTTSTTSGCYLRSYLTQLQTLLILFTCMVALSFHLSMGFILTYWPEKWTWMRKKSMSHYSRTSISVSFSPS